MPEDSVTLYRPVGQAELDLIQGLGFLRFPPRLPEQPIFYPVLSEEYAGQIARDWNTKDERSGFVGYVLRFQVKASFLTRYQPRIVGSSQHQEYWIPAQELETFNDNLLGKIEIIAEFRG
jgi:hypothetical protein